MSEAPAGLTYLKKKHQRGFIDPLSLISLAFLVVTLITTTVVVSNPQIRHDIRKLAAPATIDEPCKVCENKKCVSTGIKYCSSSLNKCSQDKNCQTVLPPPPLPPPPPPPPPLPDTMKPFARCCPRDNSASAINTCTGASESSCNINVRICNPLYGSDSSTPCPAVVNVNTFIRCCPKDNSASAKITCPGANENACNINARICEPLYSDNPNAQCGDTSAPLPLPPPPLPPACGAEWKECCGGYPNGSCNSGLYCSNLDGGTCRTKVCHAERRCEGNILKICKADGSGWDNTTCQYGCENNACKSAPTPTPTPTPVPTRAPTSTPTPTPTPTLVPSCSSAGVSGLCSSLTCCSGLTEITGMYGYCQCSSTQACTPGPPPSTRCDGTTIQETCKVDGSGWDKKYCQYGCDPLAKICKSASSPTPTPTPNCTTGSCYDMCICKGNTPSECSAACLTSTPTPTPTLRPTNTPISIPTPLYCSPNKINECKSRNMNCSIDALNNQNCVLTNECKNPLLPFAAVGLGGSKLPADYVPPNLTSASSIPNVISQPGVQVHSSVVGPLSNFGEYVKNQGYTLYITSGYRSYSQQAELHKSNPNGAAPPGESQHQTGLAVDLYLVDGGGKLSNIPDNLISAAPQFGISHPLAWDRPHFFVLSGVLGDANSWDTTFNPIAKINDDYVAMNNEITEMQKECKL